ncbi:type I restriction-modification system subunit M [Deferrisoma sp.]
MDMEALKRRFLEALAARGGSAGNQALREELGVADGTYTALVDLLVREGRVVRGRGRGGSVRLAGPAEAAAPAGPEEAGEAPRQAPARPEPLAQPRAAPAPGPTEPGQAQLTWITNFIWGIADDVLRDLYVRGKYRDVILPMTVIRRLDAVLEPTKEAVLAMKKRLDEAGIVHQDAALRQAAGQAFYNTSPFTLRDLRARASRQQLEADFRAYLDGFSPNVQEILDNFEFRNQIPRLSKADALGNLIEKFLDPSINLSPEPVRNSDGSMRLPGLDNHAMGTIFEELVRRFNEENNEEAGEHWTPRDAVKLMARLIFLPVADQIESGTYLLYDGACGTGGMLTVAEETLRQLAAERGKQVVTHLYGQEINAETYAICKADMLLKGEGEEADHIVGGPEHSTLSNDAFPSMEFDFMLSNPPYGKSWKADLERLGGKSGIRDPRFVVQHRGEELSLVTRTSDGQMLFLVNMLSKMKHGTPLGSRIAEVHNGSSLFTGDAGQGESNIRRWIIENDWLEAIVALPLNMFYNTGIATYVWVLTNRKPAHRRGRVQLIDATGWYTPLRKNLGKKNCELSEADIERICEVFLRFEETEQSKIFPNAAFGYWKVTVERPLRLKGIDPGTAYTAAEIKKLRESHERADDAPPVIRKIHNPGTEPDPLRGLFEVTIKGERRVVEYEPDTDLRDTEQIPFLECPACREPGYLPTEADTAEAIASFLRREVLPYAPDAWYDPAKVKIGYEISFNRYFYKPKALRSLEEIRADLLAVEKEAEGLLEEILGKA